MDKLFLFLITSLSLLYSNTPSRLLHLENLLCVSHIAKNLLSISQITKDDGVIVEFHSDHCLIKDKLTKKALLQGYLKDGLYKLQASFPFVPSSNESSGSTSISSVSCHVAAASRVDTLISSNNTDYVTHTRQSDVLDNSTSGMLGQDIHKKRL